MAARRVNPYRIKIHRNYEVSELARCCGVHKNTVRAWEREGLEPIDRTKPRLFHGSTVREFLKKRNAGRRRPCPPGTFYCFRCREPRPPALGMVDYVPISRTSGNASAICAVCETMMNRRLSYVGIASAMPDCQVRMKQAELRLSGRITLSPNCDFERRAPV